LQDMNSEVLSGGRYDRLVGEYGLEMPAIGFAVNVETLAACSEGTAAVSKTDALVYARDGHEAKAIRYQKELCKHSVCEFGDFADVGEALAYAQKRGIARLYVVGETVEMTDIAAD
ncbi:MAG: ATP phosphoribosyltransferase regulatory subunit, partial [Clostridia bacterium]|nr:ATP phosphoribosyltransferase regulatory subunit [Clostridia bacterium]